MNLAYRKMLNHASCLVQTVGGVAPGRGETDRRRLVAVPLAVALAMGTLAFSPNPALAQSAGGGGMNGGGVGGSGDGQGGGGANLVSTPVAGDPASAGNGGNGGSGSNGGSSGAGGAVGTTGTGGTGGNGGDDYINGGGGGGGGAGGYDTSTSGPVTLSTSYTGGNGGNGGAGTSSTSTGGGGGGGGAGYIAQYGATVQGQGVTITGGSGGNGGAGNGINSGWGGGGGGGGGDGLLVLHAGSVTVGSGVSITGGNGGNDVNYGGVGAGGAGISGAGLAITTSGTISGGLSGDGTTQADALYLTGGRNTLNLQSGWQLNGGIQIDSGTDGTGSLAFIQSSAQTVANTISGSGAVIQNGLGTLTLAGTNTYSGGTTVTSGTLVGSTASFGTGAILDNAALVIQQSGNAILANSISGTGTLAVDATGNISQTATLSPGGAATFSSGGAITLTNAGNAFGGLVTLTAAGAAELTNATFLTLGEVSASSFQVNAPSGIAVTANVTTTGDQTYAGAVTLGNDVTLTGSTLNFGATVDGAHALAISGNAAFSGAVGAGTALASLAVSGQTVLGGNVTTTGDQTYAGAVTLGTGVALTGNNITLGTGIDGNGHDLAVNAAGQAVLGEIGDVGRLSVGGAGVTTLSGSSAVASLSGSGAIALGGQGLTLTQADDTYAGAMSGSGGLTLAGGSETLTGASSYSGGTQLLGGQLNVGSDTALGTGPLDMAGDTTLGFVANGLNLANPIVLMGTLDPTIDTGAYTETLSGTISGTGDLTKLGSGTLITTAANTYSGATSVAAGTLQAGAAGTFSPYSAYSVASGATLDLAGYSQTVASLTNAGTVSLSGARPGAVLTVTGDYVGNNGLLRINTVLGDDNSVTDKMVVGGNVSGSTTVAITNVGGLGAQTVANGIEIVQVGGTSTSGAFSLPGSLHVDAGAYQYYLYKGDTSGAGNNWYLRSEVYPTPTPVVTYRQEVPLYSALPGELREADVTMLGDFHQRVGETPSESDRLAWGRVIGTDVNIRQNGPADAASTGYLAGVQTGADLWRGDGWRVGAYVGYLHGSMDVSGFAGGTVGPVGSNRTNSTFLGAYASHIWDDATYLDLVAQGGYHRADLCPSDSACSGVSGRSATLSAEFGKPFALGDGWVIEPQAQVIHQWLDFDHADISGSTTVRQSRADGWLFRAGPRLKGSFDTAAGRVEPYTRVNVFYSPSGSGLTTYSTPTSSTSLTSGAQYASTELAAGATLAVARGVKIYGEVGHLWAVGGGASVKSSVQGSGGLRVIW